MFTFHSTQFNMKGFVMVLSASLLSGLRWTLAQLVTQKNKLGKGRNENDKVGRGAGEKNQDRGQKTTMSGMGEEPEGEKILMDCYTSTQSLHDIFVACILI